MVAHGKWRQEGQELKVTLLLSELTPPPDRPGELSRVSQASKREGEDGKGTPKSVTLTATNVHIQEHKQMSVTTLPALRAAFIKNCLVGHILLVELEFNLKKYSGHLRAARTTNVCSRTSMSVQDTCLSTHRHGIDQKEPVFLGNQPPFL